MTDETGAIRFSAQYFDATSSRPQSVEALAAGGELVLRMADGERRYPLVSARIAERLAAAPRIVTFEDGSFIECSDHGAIDRAFASVGRRASWIELAQNHWRYALVAVALSVATIWLGYMYGLPRVAELAAYRVPPEVEAAIGRHAVEVIDKRLFAASKLPEDRRAALTQRFAKLAPTGGRAYRIEFRSSPILGPNAVALPGGIIVMTDELVKIAPSDEAVLAVLAHELGHVERRHFLRRLISSTVTGAVATLIAGDASGILTALPATLAELSYARDQELEADLFAVRLMRANGLDPEALAQALEALEGAHRRRSAEKNASAGKGSERADRGDRARGSWTDYVSTHPATEERIAAIRAAR